MRRLGIDIGGSSVKTCLLDGDQELCAQSGMYAEPSRDELIAAIGDAIDGLGLTPDHDASVGLCLPGRPSGSGDGIELSLNLPCLGGWKFRDLLAAGLGETPRAFRVVSDAHAAGHDYVCAHPLHRPLHHPRSYSGPGRDAVISIGTGVGLSVFDDQRPVAIGTRGIGHLGSIDIGRLGVADAIAGDGSVNTLESYVGARALRARFADLDHDTLRTHVGTLPMGDPFMTALVRAIRVVHAIYAPDRIVLLGGIGFIMSGRRTELADEVNRGLTSVASPDWGLETGESLYHAARGAALLAPAGAG